MNDLERAVAGSLDDLSTYLEITPTEDVRRHVREIQRRTVDRLLAVLMAMQGILASNAPDNFADDEIVEMCIGYADAVPKAERETR